MDIKSQASPLSVSNLPQSKVKKFFSDKRNIYSIIGLLILIIAIVFYFANKNRLVQQVIDQQPRQLTEAEQKIISDMADKAKINKPKYQDILKLESDLKTMANTNKQDDQALVESFLNTNNAKN